jgi:hypothetical protein
LATQRVLGKGEVRTVLTLPSHERVQRMPTVVALAYMPVLDIERKFRIAAVRRHHLAFGEQVTTLGGFLKTGHPDLERAVQIASDEAAIAKRVLFLSCSQKVFHLWHIVHKPFSYTFALLAVIHIVLVLMMGYF